MKHINDWHDKSIASTTVEAFKKNLFDAIYFETSGEALEYISQYIDKNSNIAFGGSVTIRDLGVRELARNKGANIVDHAQAGLSPEEKMETMRAELMSDVFICSSNAVTLDGKLVNSDAIGNRVAAMSFGPKKVIVVVGTNKICRDEEAALERIEYEAGPKNAKRLNLNTPCTKIGRCMNCNNESRICRIYSILRRKPVYTDFKVVIVGEKLGF
jgi:hypothetical protein